MSKKCPKKSKFLVLKKHRGALEFFKNPKNFLNKATKHKKNYMEGLNSKNRNIKDGGSP